MKITLICIGKTRDRNLVDGIEKYMSRISHYISFDFGTLPDLKTTSRLSETQQKEKEGAMILGALQDSDRVILLDERGTQMTSREFAQSIDRQMNAGLKRLVSHKKYITGRMPSCRCQK